MCLAKNMLVILAWASLLVSGTVNSAQAQNLPKQQCDELIYVHASEQKNFLDFPGSPFKPIVKITVSYRSFKNGVMGDEHLYEDLWYQGPNPLGCRRYRDFDINPKELLYIYLSSASSAENAASANALVRLLLDASLNRDAIIGVAVPAESFWPLVECMESENFYRPSKLNFRPSVYISLPFLADDGHKATVVWAESM